MQLLEAFSSEIFIFMVKKGLNSSGGSYIT